jgi:PHD/YefM family antitoxin component YafN of YafNO toxin-antitoxin module
MLSPNRLTDKPSKGTIFSIINSVLGGFMKTIAANHLKTKGVSSIQRALEEDTEVLISVRGKDRYVVMDLEEYNRLRVCELEVALYETRKQIAEGDYIEESVEEHMTRIKKEAQ